MEHLQNKIRYSFSDEKLLMQAITHSSYANTYETKSYERLEFFGDSILSMIVSEHLYKNYQMNEGELSKMRASIVCEQSLAQCSTNLGIGDYILLSKGEEQTGGRTRNSILADFFEAVLAAIFLDGGMEAAKRFVFDYLSETITLAANGEVHKDYKTTLQEIAQSKNKTVAYTLIGEEGPEHDKIFIAQVLLEGSAIGEGKGRNKKEAEQAAAKSGLALLKNDTKKLELI